MGLLTKTEKFNTYIQDNIKENPLVLSCILKFGEPVTILLFQYIQEFHNIESPYFSITDTQKRHASIIRSLFPNEKSLGEISSSDRKSPPHKAGKARDTDGKCTPFESFTAAINTPEFTRIVDFYQDCNESEWQQAYYWHKHKLSAAMKFWNSLEFDKEDLNTFNKVMKDIPVTLKANLELSEELKKKAFDSKSGTNLKGNLKKHQFED